MAAAPQVVVAAVAEREAGDPVLDDLGATLAVLPPPSEWSCESLVDVVRGLAGTTKVEREEMRPGLHFFHLSSGGCVSVSTVGRTAVILNLPVQDLDEASGLARVAQEYARGHKVSLEQYFFRDTGSAMFAFGTLDGARQVSTGLPGPSLLANEDGTPMLA